MQEFIDKYAEKLGIAILQHIGYVLVSVGIAVVIALVLAGVLSRYRKAAGFITSPCHAGNVRRSPNVPYLYRELGHTCSYDRPRRTGRIYLQGN